MFEKATRSIFSYFDGGVETLLSFKMCPENSTVTKIVSYKPSTKPIDKEVLYKKE